MASAAGLRDHFRCTDRRGARRRGEWRGFGTEAARRDNCRDPAGAAHPPRDFLWGNQRFASRLLQERVEGTSTWPDLPRRVGTQLLLKERWSIWGPTGDKAVASVP